MSVYVRVRPQEGYKPVQPGLAMTPRQMETLTEQGRAISAASLQNFAYYNGDYLDSGLPIDMVRGATINDIWEASKTTDAKMSKFRGKRARDLHRLAVEREQRGGE